MHASFGSASTSERTNATEIRGTGAEYTIAPVRRLVERFLTPYLLFRNWLDHPLRTRLRFARPVDQVRPAGLDAALADLPPAHQRRARDLIAAYHLERLAERGRRRDVRENLYYLDLLLTAFDRGAVELPPDRLRAVDVGVSEWFYAPALHALLRHHHATHPRDVDLVGFEADPGRRYTDGHTREDWAVWHAGGLPGARYVPTDARTWSGPVDLATLLFPFLFARDLDRWGLPRSLHHPRELLAHVWSCLEPGAYLVVVNQGEAERDVQRSLLAAVAAPVTWSGPVDSPFWRYDVPRFLHVARKPA
jgi:hypothetical protein